MNRIGRYEVVAPLGKGAFGQVFRAWDPNVGRHVAIKIVTAETDADLLERFRREAGTTANLMHKNIVTVYEFGEHDGMPFLAMELLEGQTLQDLVTDINSGKTSLPLIEKVGILAQVAEGLHYAHARGVIHRDIKPLNVMRLPNGVVKILDFGIARALNTVATRRTRDGDMVGTFLYMAPEQFRSSDADILTDIFAYGGLAYELLAGEHPFHAKDVGTIMFKITSTDPLPLHQFSPQIPDALESVVLRALAKDREIRYQSLQDVLFDLQPILQDLRADRALELLAEARPVIESGNTEAAMGYIRQVLELDPKNADGRRLRDEIQHRIQQQAVRARIQVLIEQGDSFAARRQYPDAITSYESALRLDKNDFVALQRLEDARAKQEAKRRSARLIGEAREQMDAGNLAEAKNFAEQAVETDTQNTEAHSLLERIQAAIVQREREERLRRLLTQVENMRDAADFAGALAQLDAIAAEFPESGDLARTRAQIDAEQREYERRKRHEAFEARIAEVHTSANSGRLDEALTQIQAVIRDYPEEAAAADFARQLTFRLEQEKRRQAIEEAAALAEARLAAGSLDDALATIDSALTQYAGEQRLTEVRARTVAALEKRERQRRVAEVVASIDAAVAGDRADEALTLAEQASLRFPAEPTIEDALARARAAKAEADRQHFIRTAIAQATALETAGNWEAALVEANGALRFCPESTELIAIHQRITQRIEEHRHRLAEQQQAIEAAFEAKDWLRAVIAAESARQEHPESDLFLEYAARAWREQRRVELRNVTEHVRHSLKSDNLDDAESLLTVMQPVFGGEMVIQLLAKELGQRRNVQTGISRADALAREGRYGEAEEVLARLSGSDLSTVHDQVQARLNGIREQRARLGNEQAGRE